MPHVPFRQHGHIESVKRYDAFGQYESVFTWNCCMVAGVKCHKWRAHRRLPNRRRTSLASKEGAVGHRHNQYAFFRQQECNVSHVSLSGSRCSMTCHRVMTSKLSGVKSFKAVWGFTSILKCSLANARAWWTFLHCLHLPAAALHGIGKVARSRTYIQQTPRFAVGFAHHEGRFCASACSCAPNDIRSSSLLFSYPCAKYNRKPHNIVRFRSLRERLA